LALQILQSRFIGRLFKVFDDAWFVPALAQQGQRGSGLGAARIVIDDNRQSVYLLGFLDRGKGQC
jgi:hypothetical protein